MALAKLSDRLLINRCAQVSSEDKTKRDGEIHQHIVHSIYLYPQCVCPFAYSHYKHYVVDDTSDKTRRQLISSAFIHYPGSFVSLCGPRRADDEGHLRVSSLWPDKSRIEQRVIRAAEVASALDERARMEIVHFKRGRLGFNQSCIHWSIGMKYKDGFKLQDFCTVLHEVSYFLQRKNCDGSR